MFWLLDPETWIALVTLTALEIVLGVDNIVFISILAASSRGRSKLRPAGSVSSRRCSRASPSSCRWPG